jgi:hypothetical protein
MSADVSIRQHTSACVATSSPISSSKLDSGKHKIHKIVSNAPFVALDFGSRTKKAVMTEKKVIAPRNLNRLDQVYHSKQGK